MALDINSTWQSIIDGRSGFFKKKTRGLRGYVAVFGHNNTYVIKYGMTSKHWQRLDTHNNMIKNMLYYPATPMPNKSYFVKAGMRQIFNIHISVDGDNFEEFMHDTTSNYVRIGGKREWVYSDASLIHSIIRLFSGNEFKDKSIFYLIKDINKWTTKPIEMSKDSIKELQSHFYSMIPRPSLVNSNASIRLGL